MVPSSVSYTTGGVSGGGVGDGRGVSGGDG